MRGTSALGRQREEPEGAGPFADALIALLVQGLGLERAALLIAAEPGQPLVALAVHGTGELPPMRAGEPPGSGPWSLVVPLHAGSRSAGLLLLARPGGAALEPVERALAERLAQGAARVVEHGWLGAELAHSQELLARADRLSALGLLAAGVTHEIRNPLVSVRTFIQLLPERLADEEYRTTFRELALGEIDRICGLINDLLAFSRPMPAEREATDLNEVVGQIVRLVDAEARREDVTVTTHEDPGLPPVVADEAQVKQVLMNVILNGIQASAPHGTVVVATSRRDQWCLVEVSDSGPGIAPDDAERVFDPFFTTKSSGSGLGLFVARRIVAEHGGQITIAPRSGGGTLFAIHFPMRARAREAGGRAG